MQLRMLRKWKKQESWILVTLFSTLPSSCYSVKTWTNARKSLERTCVGYLPYFLLFLLPLTCSFSSPCSSEMLGLAGTEVLDGNAGISLFLPSPWGCVPLLPQFLPLLENTGLLRNRAINLSSGRIRNEWFGENTVEYMASME